MTHDDGPTCAVCTEPIVPGEYADTRVWLARDRSLAAHLRCLDRFLDALVSLDD